MIGLLAAVIPLAFYLAYPSTFWNFDGVACAAALELGHPIYFFHAQHLLYGFAGFLFWKLLLPLGFVKALPALQIFTSLLGSAALFFLWRSLYQLSQDRGLALGLTCAAGFSAAFWVWSIEAQVYALGVLGLAGATAALLSPSPRMKTIGFWHALAIGGHLVHGLWLIPALYLMRKRQLPLKPYLLTVFSVVIGAYTAVTLFVVVPYHGQGPWLSNWFKGSLGLTQDRSIGWHWPGISGPWLWLKATPGVLWGSFWPYAGTHISSSLSALAIISTALMLGLVIFQWRGALQHRTVVRFSVLWLVVYALFFSTWEPETLCYRMTDIIPFTFILMVALIAIPQRLARLSLAVGWMVSLGLVNFKSRALPMHDIERNKVYQQTLRLAKISPEHSMYMTSGGEPWIYLLYFTGRSAWNARTLSFDEFERHWEALKPAPPLYIYSGLLRDPKIAPAITRRHLKVISDIPWLEVS